MILRSGLFAGRSAAGSAGRRGYAGPEPLPAYGGAVLQQRGGQQLDQPSATVWMELVRLSLALPVDGDQVLITLNEADFLKSLNRGDGGNDYAWLRETIARLGDARYQLLWTDAEGTKLDFTGSLVGNILRVTPAAGEPPLLPAEAGPPADAGEPPLIPEGAVPTQPLDELAQRKLKIKLKRIANRKAKRASAGQAITGLYLNTQLIKLFGLGNWSKLDRELRDKLADNPLAQWLYGFYVTHANPFQLKIQTICDLSGNHTKRQATFRRHLSIALAALAAVTGWRCGISLDGMVVVARAEDAKVPALEPAPAPSVPAAAVQAPSVPAAAVPAPSVPAAAVPAPSVPAAEVPYRTPVQARLELVFLTHQQILNRATPAQQDRYQQLAAVVYLHRASSRGKKKSERYLLKTNELLLEAARIARGHPPLNPQRYIDLQAWL